MDVSNKRKSVVYIPSNSCVMVAVSEHKIWESLLEVWVVCVWCRGIAFRDLAEGWAWDPGVSEPIWPQEEYPIIECSTTLLQKKGGGTIKLLPLMGLSPHTFGFRGWGETLCMSVAFAVSTTSFDTTSFEVRPTTIPGGQVTGLQLQ